MAQCMAMDTHITHAVSPAARREPDSVSFEELAEHTKRNIEIKSLREIIDEIIRDSSKDIQSKKVSPFGEFVN